MPYDNENEFYYEEWGVSTDTADGTAKASVLRTSIDNSAFDQDIFGVRVRGGKIWVMTDIEMTASNKTIVDGLVSNHKAVLSPLKIHVLAKDEARDKHPHNINYKTELKQALYPKRTFVQGELQKVEWYCDQAATDKVLETSMTYVRDAFGFATSRTTTRTWFRQDGTSFEEPKVTEKIYTLNYNDQIVEGKRRRQNIVDGIQLPVMGMLVEVLHPTPQVQVLLMGRDFLDRMELYFQRFIDNSSSINDTQDPNFGKKEIVVEFENATDSWMDGTPTALGGATIRQYLIAEFTI